MLGCHLLEACSFLMRDRKGVDPEGRGAGRKSFFLRVAMKSLHAIETLRHTFNPSTGAMERRGSLGMTGQTASKKAMGIVPEK